MFLTFSLAHVLRATTACTFSSSQLPKCASRHNGVQFFVSHLASWLRTRRFSEPTFRPSMKISRLAWFSRCRLERALASVCSKQQQAASKQQQAAAASSSSKQQQQVAAASKQQQASGSKQAAGKQQASSKQAATTVGPLERMINYIPVVPHKAVAEVSKIGNL